MAVGRSPGPREKTKPPDGGEAVQLLGQGRD